MHRDLDRHLLAAPFEVLERCEGAGTLDDFRMLVVESVERAYGVRSATFFTGSSSSLACADREPVVTGITRHMLPVYQEYWHRHDVFSSPSAGLLFDRTGVAGLQELDHLDAEGLRYVTDYLQHHSIEAAAALRLDLPDGRRALVGLFDRSSDVVGPAELASLRLLARPLGRIAAGLEPADPGPGILDELSPRQAEVARLVADGLGNAAIAELMHLNEASVKKYVSRIIEATGCRNRTEIAIRVRSSL